MSSPAHAHSGISKALQPGQAEAGGAEAVRRTVRPIAQMPLVVLRRLAPIMRPVARRIATLAPLLAPSPLPAGVRAGTAPGASARLLTLTRAQVALASFLLAVVLPTAATFLYLWLVAMPQFRSEARLVVRGNLETIANSGAPTSGNGVPQVPNSQEARVVVDYLKSRAMVDALQQQFDLRRVFGVSGRDPVFALAADASMEDVLAYWNRQVSVSLESLSGVIKVQVDAFSPESAALLAAFILRQAEAVTNELTTRNRGDRVLQAQAEERSAFAELALVRTELEQFRNVQGTIDPTRSALNSFTTIAKLRDQRSSLNTDLSAARARLDEDSPVVRALKERLRSLDEKIAALDSALLGGTARPQEGSSANLAASAAIEMRRRMAEQRLQRAEAELMDARAQQAQKQVYILTFMAPSMPADRAFPHPFLQAAAVFGILAAAWAVIALYVTSVYARSR